MITVTIKSTSGISDGEEQFETLAEAEKFIQDFFGIDSLDDATEYAGRTYTLPGGTTQATIRDEAE